MRENERSIRMKLFLLGLDKPKIRIESQNREPFIINSTATFRCIIQSNPPGDYRSDRFPFLSFFLLIFSS